MTAMFALTTACAAGIAFYLRFLIALLLERRRAMIGMLLRLTPVAEDEQQSDAQQGTNSTARAA